MTAAALTNMSMSDPLAAAEQFLRREIPLTRTMGLRVVPHENGFAVEAPVAQNSNHLGTAFGGSINSVATLAGYTFLWLQLRDQRANIVIGESSIHFVRPIRETIRAVCVPVDAEQITQFKTELRSTGKARLTLAVRVEEGGTAAAHFRGTFIGIIDAGEAAETASL